MKNPRLVLAGFSPSLQGLKWETRTGFKIGRVQSADIVLNDSSVGRQHAEISFDRSAWVVRDLLNNQRHPTLVNGKFLGESQWTLKTDDVIHFGNLALQVEALEVAGKEAVAASRPSEALAARHRSNPETDTPTLPGVTIKTSGSFVRVEAASRRTWDEALTAATEVIDCGPGQRPNLIALLRTGQHLSRIESLDELLESVLDDAVRTLGAQRGCILLVDHLTGELRLWSALAPRLPVQQQSCYSRTMTQRCFNKGESVLCSDVMAQVDLQGSTSIRLGAMTSLICALLRSPRKRLGVLHLDRGPTQKPFDENDFFLADAVAASLSIGIECAQLVEEQRDQFAQTVASLARAVEVRDYYTGNHTRRVTDYALCLADELKVSAGERHQIKIGTPLHDVGKIGVDDAVLRKPDRLTPEEFEHMKLHTVKGAEILGSISALRPMIPIVRNHHERWDGSGYPDGLKGDQIARLARIVAVADAFDAMTSDRPYRRALSIDTAIAELTAKAGSHFDPACVTAFLGMRPYVEHIMKQS